MRVIFKEFASGLSSFLFEKIFLAKHCKSTEKLTSTATGEIIEVESVTKYMSCYKYYKNIQPTITYHRMPKLASETKSSNH